MAADKAELHIPTVIDGVKTANKIIKCSCGIICGSREMYFHHVECTQSNNKILPRDASLWPLRFFKTVPNIKCIQRGCVARNSKYEFVKYVVIWLNRMQDDDKNISFSQKFIQTALPKLKSFVASIPLLCTMDNAKPSESIASMIALSNDVWTQMIDEHEKLQKPKELRQFKAKYSYVDENDCALPIYEKNYKFDDNQSDSMHAQTQPDIFIMIKSNNANDQTAEKLIDSLDKDIIAHIEQTNGFTFNGGKDLTGFIDGTKNLDYNLRILAETVSINDNANKSGSYVYCSRFIHDFRSFKKLDTKQKSDIIGRDYGRETVSKSLDGRIENPRIRSSLKGHVFRSWGDMYRQSYPV